MEGGFSVIWDILMWWWRRKLVNKPGELKKFYWNFKIDLRRSTQGKYSDHYFVELKKFGEISDGGDGEECGEELEVDLSKSGIRKSIF